MSAEEKKDPYLKVRFEGPEIRAGRMKLDDFLQLASEFSSAAKRVALVLQNARSTGGGRRSEDLLRSLSLDIVGFTHGSPAAVALFERSEDQLVMEEVDLGEQAYRALLTGIPGVAEPGDQLPSGYDLGVLLKIRDIGKVFNRGVNSIHFTLNHREAPISAVYDPGVFEEVRKRLDRPDAQQVTVQGRLLMADFKETKHRLRVHPAVGSPVNCVFPDELSDEVEESMRKFVRVSGNATYNEQGEMVQVRMSNIETVEEASEEAGAPAVVRPRDPFWEGQSLDELIEEAGQMPVANFDALLGGWPEEEIDDDFENVYREERKRDL